MPRKKCNRYIESEPLIKSFVPKGKACRLEIISLQLDEYESIRLIDYLNLSQEEASSKMGVSRPTITRIYDDARKKISKAIVEGKAINISLNGGIIIRNNCKYCNKIIEPNMRDSHLDNSGKPLICKNCSINNSNGV